VITALRHVLLPMHGPALLVVLLAPVQRAMATLDILLHASQFLDLARSCRIGDLGILMSDDYFRTHNAMF